MLIPYTLDKYFDKLLDMEYSNYYSDIQYSQTSTEEQVIIELAVPGVEREDLKIDVAEGTLFVEAKPKSKSKFAKEIKQSWNLSKNIDVDNINAELKNGLLTLTLPKVKPVKKTVNVVVS
jgi:HSP20 family protein